MNHQLEVQRRGTKWLAGGREDEEQCFSQLVAVKGCWIELECYTRYFYDNTDDDDQRNSTQTEIQAAPLPSFSYSSVQSPGHRISLSASG